MTKVVTIETCRDCPEFCIELTQDGLLGVCAHDAIHRTFNHHARAPYLGIPDWCPLPDAPAWPRVIEIDAERDEGSCIEAPAVLAGVNLLEEVTG